VYTFQGIDPADRLVILENGANLVMERTFPAGQAWRDNGGAHLHQHQDEILVVLAGILSVRMGEEVRTFVAGEHFEIQRGSPHAICNRGSRPARIRWEVRPALNTADFLGDVYHLDPRPGKGGLFKRAALYWTYRDVYTPAWPPLWVQSVLFPALASIGRLLGHPPKGG
jgi:quercetin dioxygenase-like cupin family protein